mmetsp:Transcript_77373/g.199156  ORF Transcript_77373/g.199156 Transcript_77373/m.199156 type:complete len:239 (+) Transcript_77373:40-756(+)
MRHKALAKGGRPPRRRAAAKGGGIRCRVRKRSPGTPLAHHGCRGLVFDESDLPWTLAVAAGVAQPDQWASGAGCGHGCLVAPLTLGGQADGERGLEGAEEAALNHELLVLEVLRICKRAQVNIGGAELVVGGQAVGNLATDAQHRVLVQHVELQGVRARRLEALEKQLLHPLRVGVVVLDGGLHRASHRVAVRVHDACLDVRVRAALANAVLVAEVRGLLDQDGKASGHGGDGRRLTA